MSPANWDSLIIDDSEILRWGERCMFNSSLRFKHKISQMEICDINILIIISLDAFHT